jgi:hypothetical protein
MSLAGGIINFSDNFVSCVTKPCLAADGLRTGVARVEHRCDVISARRWGGKSSDASLVGRAGMEDCFARLQPLVAICKTLVVGLCMNELS